MNTERFSRRAMLAVIALVDVPMPRQVALIITDDNRHILSMTFESITDARLWSAYLGGRSDTYVLNGRRYIDEGVIRWHGWSVQFHASEPATADAVLDDATRAELVRVVNEREV